MRIASATTVVFAVAVTLVVLPSSQATSAATLDTGVAAYHQGEGSGITSSHAKFELIDMGATPASYDVRVSRASMRSPRRGVWTRPAHLQGITRSILRIAVAPGQAVCLSARARDAEGNVEPWQSASHSCTVRALGAAKLERRGHVQVIRKEGYYGGSASLLHPGSALTLHGVPRGAMVGVVYRDWPRRRLNWWYPRDGAGPGGTTFDHGRPGRRWLLQVNQFGRKASLRFGTGDRTSEPFEGVAIYPSWVRR